MKKSIASRGSIYIVVGALFYATYGIWSKMMGDVFDEFYQSWTRSLMIVAVLLIIGILFKQLRKIEKKDIKWYFAYSLPGSISVPGMFYAYNRLSVGTASVLFYSMLTISTYIYGILFFKEKMTQLKIIALIIGIAGLLVTYSLSLNGNVFAMFVAIASGIGAGTEATFTKRLSDKYSSIQLALAMFAVCFFCTLIIFLFNNNFSFDIDGTIKAWMFNIGHAVSSLCAFILVVKGFKYLDPSVAGIIGLLEISFGIILAFIILSEPVSLPVVIGGGLIIMASMLPDLYTLMNGKEIK